VSSIHLPAEIAPGIDIASIVRRVVHELKRMEAVEVVSQQPDAARATTFVFDHRVITLSDIDGVPAAMKTIELPAGGIVTPAVRDVLRGRGITVVHATSKPVASQVGNADGKTKRSSPFRPIHLQHDESIDTNLLGSVENQLSIRGIKLCNQASRGVMLSSHPAATVYRCISDHVSAVSINRIDDVLRFKKELNPSVYVIDVQHLNLISIVNAIVQIARKGGQK
jgi:hypothetical protein